MSYKRQIDYATVHMKTREKLDKLYDIYTDIFSKHSTDIDKTDLVQLAFIPKDNFKPLDPELYTLPIKHLACLEKN